MCVQARTADYLKVVATGHTLKLSPTRTSKASGAEIEKITKTVMVQTGAAPVAICNSWGFHIPRLLGSLRFKGAVSWRMLLHACRSQAMCSGHG